MEKNEKEESKRIEFLKRISTLIDALRRLMCEAGKDPIQKGQGLMLLVAFFGGIVAFLAAFFQGVEFSVITFFLAGYLLFFLLILLRGSVKIIKELALKRLPET